MTSLPGAHPASKRELAAWAFYDFANSGYTTVVMTTIYSAYFVGVIAAGLDEQSPGTATLLWTLAIGAANLFVLLAGPVIGAVADHRARKKRYLLASSVLCVLGTAGLALVGSEEVPAIPQNRTLEVTMLPNSGKVLAVLQELIDY